MKKDDNMPLVVTYTEHQNKNDKINRFTQNGFRKAESLLVGKVLLTEAFSEDGQTPESMTLKAVIFSTGDSIGFLLENGEIINVPLFVISDALACGISYFMGFKWHFT